MDLRSITSIVTHAEESNNSTGYYTTAQNPEDAAYVSKDLQTGIETYYDLYKGNTKIAPLDSEETQEEDYSLYSPGFIPNAQKESALRSLVGSDNRSHITSTAHPFSAICYITSYWPNGSSTGGTAWMYWDDIAITAGHCVYNKSCGGWATSIIVKPCANGSNNPYGTVYARHLHSGSQWTDNSNPYYDYGVIELTAKIGNDTGWFGTLTRTKTFKNSDITIVGYPGEYYRQMWGMSGKVKRNTIHKIYYDIDTTPGQSGSPVYQYNSEYGYVAIAIHTNGSSSITTNSGTRITKDLFDYFASFRV